MRTRTFGPLSQPVAVIGQGTWNMESDDRASAVAALRAGLDAGVTHIDTAELYGRGEVETLVAEAIGGRRDEVFLVSKVLPYNASRRGTISACDATLRRLNTDHLDLYLLHWPGDHPLEETFAAFAQLESDGKIGAFGVSNFAVPELKRVLEIVGSDRIACNQVLYHLGERTIEHRIVPFCREHGIAVVAYSPFGSGDFPHDHPTLEAIAARRSATVHQVALAFLTREQHVFAIPKASQSAHVLDNAAAADVILEAKDIAELEDAFPKGRDRPGIATL